MGALTPIPADLRRPLANAHQALVAAIHLRTQMRRDVESHAIILNLQGYPPSLQDQAGLDLLRVGVLAGVVQALRAVPSQADATCRRLRCDLVTGWVWTRSAGPIPTQALNREFIHGTKCHSI